MYTSLSVLYVLIFNTFLNVFFFWTHPIILSRHFDEIRHQGAQKKIRTPSFTLGRSLVSQTTATSPGSSPDSRRLTPRNSGTAALRPSGTPDAPLRAFVRARGGCVVFCMSEFLFSKRQLLPLMFLLFVYLYVNNRHVCHCPCLFLCMCATVKCCTSFSRWTTSGDRGSHSFQRRPHGRRRGGRPRRPGMRHPALRLRRPPLACRGSIRGGGILFGVNCISSAIVRLYSFIEG